MRYFNTTGPVVAAVHYCVPPLERVNPRELRPVDGCVEAPANRQDLGDLRIARPA